MHSSDQEVESIIDTFLLRKIDSRIMSNGRIYYWAVKISGKDCGKALDSMRALASNLQTYDKRDETEFSYWEELQAEFERFDTSLSSSQTMVYVGGISELQSRLEIAEDQYRQTINDFEKLSSSEYAYILQA